MPAFFNCSLVPTDQRSKLQPTALKWLKITQRREERGRRKRGKTMTQTIIIIRPATAADHPFIFSLSTRLAMVAQLPGRKEAEIQAFQDRHMQAALGKTGDQSATLVAAMPTGPVLGFIHLQPKPDPVTSEPAGYVSMLAVVPEAEGQGIAQQLMEAAENWARAHGFRCLSLDVFASNERARRFYDRIGFAEDSVKLYKLLK